MTDILKLNQILIFSAQPDFEKKLLGMRDSLQQADHFAYSSPKHRTLQRLILNVKRNGDKAVCEYTEKFDSVKLTAAEFRVSSHELETAHKEMDSELLGSLRQAIANVKKYQSEIFVANTTHPGIKYTPLKRVGLCIPGASAPLPSTVIMTAVPAQVAGVEQIAVISPPRHNGSIHSDILAVCHELGIDEVYRIGGAQGVAALAYGTETIPKVCKIAGPGGMWVQMAKKEVFGAVDIDSIAGPSEVLIIANESANPAWVAADMLSQAEHAPGSALVFTDSQDFAN